MTNSKRTPSGRTERENLVNKQYRADYAAARATLPRNGQYANDDLLDAFSALWTAERFIKGNHIVLPNNPPPVDSCGLRMQMRA